MKNLPFWIYAIIFLLGCNKPPSHQEERPNLILIIADDLNWDDVGAYGHPHIQTPNIDRLAKEGMRFTNAFLTTSSCSPSRASIITGTYPHQTDAEQLHWPLPGDRITFVEKLKEAGYWTAQAGKWHLGDAVKDRFDLLMPEGTSGFVFKEEVNPESTPAEVDGSGCQNWLNVLNARPKEKPFFLWLAAVDPHRPYKKGIIPNPHKEADVIVPPYLPDLPEVRRELALYYDEATRLDNYVGELMDALETQNLQENTLVLFISDNGRAFPRDKTTLYDGGIKTPWIVSWPNKVSSNTISHSLVSAVDIATTFMSLAGIKELLGFEGVDFTPILSNPEMEIRDIVFAQDHWHDFEDYTRAIRNKRFKYIKNFLPEIPATVSADVLRDSTFQMMIKLNQKGELTEAQQACFISPRPIEELYDMQNDPFEMENLAADAAYEEILLGMRNLLVQIQQKTGDPIDIPYFTPDEFDRQTGKPTDARIRPRLSKKEMIANGMLRINEGKD